MPKLVVDNPRHATIKSMVIKNKNFALRTVALFVILASLIVAYIFVDFVAISDYFRGISYEPTVEMANLKNDLNLTKRASSIFAASRPELEDSDEFNKSCASINPEISILGCYADDKIYVYNIESPDLQGIKQSTLAHELLHAAWDRLSDNAKDQLSTELENAYEDNIEILESRLSLYPESQFYDELHSIIGTEYADLSASLEDHYARYFNDQDSIVVFYNNYNIKFQELKDEAEALYAQIETNRKLIDAKNTNYNDAAAELNAAIVDFNRRAENGYFSSVAAFNAERATLVAEQQKLDTLYAEVSALIDSTNQLIEEYNSNIANTQVLLDVINSNTDTPSTELEDSN